MPSTFSELTEDFLEDAHLAPNAPGEVDFREITVGKLCTAKS